MKKRILAMLLVLAMVLTYVPSFAMATESGSATVLGNGYVQTRNGETFVTMDIYHLNAEESVALELYSGETKIATTTLQKPEYYHIDTLSVKFCIVGGSSSWTTVWEDGKLRADYVPTSAKLIVDGEEIDTATVTVNSVDAPEAEKIEWADVNGVNPAPETDLGNGFVMTEGEKSYIGMDITGLNAKESVVLELFSGETKIATTTLQKPEYYHIDTLSVKFCIVGGSSSWTTVWEDGKLHADYVPTSAVLYVDGVEKATSTVTVNNPYDTEAEQITWANVAPSESLDIGTVMNLGEKTYVYVEANNVNATSDVVAELYSGNTKLATTTLIDKDAGNLNTNVLGIKFCIVGDSSSWNTVWEEGKLRADWVPTSVKLFIDGEKVSENTVEIIGDNNTEEWADVKGVQPTPATKLGDGFVMSPDSKSYIGMDIEYLNAKESVVVELYSGETKIATTTLLKPEYYHFDKLSVKFCITADSGSWKTVWESGKLRDDYEPTSAKLFVDGKEVDTAKVTINNPVNNEAEKITWANVDGVGASGDLDMTNGFVVDPEGESYIMMEINNLNAKKSVVVELYSGETKVATTTLKKLEYARADTLTVKFCITDTSSSWNTVWETGKLRADYEPDKAVLIVDGKVVDTSSVTVNNPADTAAEQIAWADVNGVVPTPATELGNGFAMNVEGESYIGMDIAYLNARESVVVELYSGETKIATTTLQKPEYFRYDALSVKICILGDSSSWNTVWEEEKLRADWVPTSANLIVDGKVVDTATVTVNNPFNNEVEKIEWADVNGVNPAPETDLGNGFVMTEGEKSYIGMDITGLNAKESVVLELFSGETKIATTTLQKPEYYHIDTLSVKFCIAGESSSWKTVWEEGKLRADYVPTSANLIVDGKVVDTAEVTVNNPYDTAAEQIEWADVKGVNPTPDNVLDDGFVMTVDGETYVGMEIYYLNAKESVVLELFSGETKIATTTLKKAEYFHTDVLSVKFCITGDSSSWETKWEDCKLNAAYAPTSAKLYVDGKEVDTANVTVNNPYDTEAEQIEWADVEGVYPAVDVKHNLTLESYIDFSFFIPKNIAADGLTATVTQDRLEGYSDKSVTIAQADWESVTVGGVEYWRIRFSDVAAKEMADKLTLVISDGNVVVVTDVYSIQQYAEERIQNSTNADMKSLMEALLAYGSAAQNYFDYK